MLMTGGSDRVPGHGIRRGEGPGRKVIAVMRQQFGDYQSEIYFNGLFGVVPKYPMAFDGWEKAAQAALPPSVWSYVAGGAGDEHTQRANVRAFERWALVPRMLVGAADRDLSVGLFGLTLPSPLLMSPVGVLGLCAQDGHGDLAAARAAALTGVPMIASTLSNDPLEDVAKELGDTPGFFQLYTPTDRELAASLVRRAEAAGFKGIVVTLDTCAHPYLKGWPPDQRKCQCRADTPAAAERPRQPLRPPGAFSLPGPPRRGQGGRTDPRLRFPGAGVCGFLRGLRRVRLRLQRGAVVVPVRVGLPVAMLSGHQRQSPGMAVA